MTRPDASTITDDQLDALHARLEQAEKLLSHSIALAEITHKYRSQGRHDVLGANLGCAGCELTEQMRAHLTAHTLRSAA